MTKNTKKKITFFSNLSSHQDTFSSTKKTLKNLIKSQQKKLIIIKMQKLNSSASSGHAIFFHNDIKKIEKFKTQKVVK